MARTWIYDRACPRRRQIKTRRLQGTGEQRDATRRHVFPRTLPLADLAGNERAVFKRDGRSLIFLPSVDIKILIWNGGVNFARECIGLLLVCHCDHEDLSLIMKNCVISLSFVFTENTF